MVYTHKKKAAESPKLDMTPMIDVVFQLLIFFVVALKQEDILSKLVVARPRVPPETIDIVPLQDIVISEQGFTFGGRPMRLDELDKVLKRLSISKTATLVIKCTKDSPHAFLIQALDVCNKHEITNLSVMSL